MMPSFHNLDLSYYSSNFHQLSSTITRTEAQTTPSSINCIQKKIHETLKKKHLAHHDIKAQIRHLPLDRLRSLPKQHLQFILPRTHHPLFTHNTRPRPHVPNLAALRHQSPLPLHNRRNIRETHLPPELQQAPTDENPRGATATDPAGGDGGGAAGREVRIVGVGQFVSRC